MIVSIFALKHGLLRVVQVSLIGSVLSNMLLVLGTAFLVGGVKHNTQRYNKAAAITNTGLLTLSVLAILFPAVLDATHQEKSSESILILSRLTSLLTLFVYGFLIYYQLKTHRYLFEGQEEEEEEEAILGFWGGIFWMGVITVFIAFLSEFIVSAIEGAATSLGVPILFIGTILLPIVGNAAEHAAAIIFAYKNKMDLSLGIAVGSAAQISLFVIPFTVLIAWMMGRDLSLDFHIFETAVLFMTVVLVSFTLQNGDSDWLKGAMLVVAYFLVSASFWVHKDPDASEGF
jgi:Ca2+:H+ antiporter